MSLVYYCVTVLDTQMEQDPHFAGSITLAKQHTHTNQPYTHGNSQATNSQNILHTSINSVSNFVALRSRKKYTHIHSD